MAEGKMVNLGNALAKWSQTIIDALRKDLKEDDTVASGRLRASIHPVIKVFGNRFEMQFMMEDYWKSVDEGTKPGTKPNIAKILKWMGNKRIQPRQTKLGLTGGRSKRARKVYKDRKLALAERIANAIYKRGTIKRFNYKGTGFVSDYTKTLEKRMTESIRQATGKDITIQIKNVLK